MSERIDGLFQGLRAQSRAALVPFLTAGDPHPAVTVELMHTLVAAGADMIELGIPFSDPMADGPVIQQASERALAQGVCLQDVLALAAQFRRDNERTPLILMGYLNPIEAMGYTEFVATAQAAGVDGVIVVDLPPEEGGDLGRVLMAAGIDPVFLLAPTTTEARIERVCSHARGFVYYVSLRGVTGAANLDVSEVSERISTIKRHTRLPVGVGFGINDARTAARMAEFADAVIVGSAVVRRIAEAGDDIGALKQSLSEFVSELRDSIGAVNLRNEAAGA